MIAQNSTQEIGHEDKILCDPMKMLRNERIGANSWEALVRCQENTSHIIDALHDTAMEPTGNIE